MDIQIKGLDKLLSAFHKAGVELPGQFRRAMTVSVVKIKEDARDFVAIKTGALKTSITQRVDSNPLIGQVMVGQPYGKYVEFGTMPHTIYPKNGSMLAFKIGGKMIFTRKVNHPGTKAKPFMRTALQGNVFRVRENFQRATEAIVKMLAGK